MPREERDAAPGIFHVWTHSVWTNVLYLDDIDRMSWVTELAAMTAKYEWSCIGFCQLTTHYHLIVETFDESLSNGMQRLNFRHAIGFNRRHKLRGHVVDGRFSSRRITTEEQLVTTYRYVARNPIEANLCKSPGDWPWCSYRSVIEPVEPFTFVDVSRVACCFRPAETAVEQLRRFVESAW
jgi:REP element-mobilizing transposase RayT